MARLRLTLNGRSGGPLTHSSYTTRGDTTVNGATELFRIAPQIASAKLREIDQIHILNHDKVDLMFNDHQFINYLLRLFECSGLKNWIDLQGSWTIGLFRNTSGGRYYTINIGSHEVAFTTTQKFPRTHPGHSIVLDRLIYDFPTVEKWVSERNGSMHDELYASALPRSVSVYFEGNFKEAEDFLQLDGVRRALIAYWADALTGMSERQSLSPYARYHDWNAVAHLKIRLEQSRALRS